MTGASYKFFELTKNLLCTFAAAFCAAALMSSIALANGSFSISDKIIFPIAAGEAQSTVVAPGLKPQCPAGRLFLSNDFMVRRTPITTGAVLWRDLDKLDQAAGMATFGAVPNAEYFTSGTDHDLVSLNNGDVFLIDMISSKAPITPKPIWFDQTFRDNDKTGDFGPGARTAIGVWRSTDCGESFTFASVIETGDYGDHSCNWPQRPGPDAHHPLDMGGSDGISAHVSLAGDKIMIINQCVGLKPNPSVSDAFVLSKQRIDKSLVLESSDGAKTWKLVGVFPKAEWRRSFVNRDLTVDFAVGNGVTSAKRQPDQTLLIDQNSELVPDFTPTNSATPGAKVLNATYGNIWAHTIVAHVPGRKRIVLAVPTMIKRASGNMNGGYRIFMFDHAQNKYAELPPVLPQADAPDNYMMHLVAIDSGKGPVMLYWSEFDVTQKTGQVRGRLIFNTNEASDDFVVSLLNGQPSTWALEANRHYWYGDYQTAASYTEKPMTNNPNAAAVYDFYPMWVEGNRTTDFAHVKVTVPANDGTVSKLNGIGAPNIVVLPESGFSLPATTVKLSEMDSSIETAEHDEDDADENMDNDKDKDVDIDKRPPVGKSN